MSSGEGAEETKDAGDLEPLKNGERPGEGWESPGLFGSVWSNIHRWFELLRFPGGCAQSADAVEQRFSSVFLS